MREKYAKVNVERFVVCLYHFLSLITENCSSTGTPSFSTLAGQDCKFGK